MNTVIPRVDITNYGKCVENKSKLISRDSLNTLHENGEMKAREGKQGEQK